MIVEWKDVTLRDNRPGFLFEVNNELKLNLLLPAGNFTFQVHLWRNGSITFIYKEVYLGEMAICQSIFSYRFQFRLAISAILNIHAKLARRQGAKFFSNLILILQAFRMLICSITK
jgi:hypothetical protein